ncbi:hypothetical protein T4D_4075 [Trichinella pseudospiralis]|uniref:Uncharacterized protein n=1 Tax=Trichinella pseudospiralis TaxID=6337 RepID=A0A0V1F541_TRIPS|nr:hypothetical protein T4D_4075 [Trichinella pseudospiralis]
MAVVSELRLVKIVALVCMFLVFESRIHKLRNREEIPGCSKTYLEVTAVISGKLPSGSACSMPYGNEDYLKKTPDSLQCFSV